MEREIFLIQNTAQFEKLAMQVWHLQYQNNPLYREFCDLVKRNKPSKIDEIAFMPISFFKQFEVKTTAFNSEIIFKSSGTTGSVNSSHFVKKEYLYELSFRKAFAHFYGDISEYDFYSLLPNYQEKGDSSLVYMADNLMKSANCSGFFLHQYEDLFQKIQNSFSSKKKVILLGVSFALMDFADFSKGKFSSNNSLIVMETGGMKGRRKELIRAELHAYLKERLGVKNIHSEFGMTELLSQGYSKGEGIYSCPRWMKALIGDPYEPLSVKENGEGVLKIIDLANLYSCSFIATQDIGKVDEKGDFEVLGRFDYSDVRGCNLMVG